MGVARSILGYGVPAWMIAECTAARERGDWRGVCAAGRVDVGFRDAGPVAELLAGFAPERLRRYLPRTAAGSGGVVGGMRGLLAPDGPVTAGTMVLEVRSSSWSTGSQRLTLNSVRAGDLARGRIVPLPPELWDARRAAPTPTPAGRVWPLEAWAAAGWGLAGVGESFWSRSGQDLLLYLDPVRAARELRRVAGQYGRWSWPLRTGLRGEPFTGPDWHLRLELIGDRHRVSWVSESRDEPELCLHPALLRPPGDDFAPLAEMVPDGFGAEEPLRVRCGTVWHRIGMRGGRFALLDHDDGDERRREHLLAAIGGAMRGCYRAEAAWFRGGPGLPRGLREYRRDLWRRMEHGGARVVHALLDAGLDPHFRDDRGRTLLHRLHQFEHGELLPRLLAAGLDVNARSRAGYTPMCEVLANDGPYDLAAALHAAGAHPRLADGGIA